MEELESQSVTQTQEIAAKVLDSISSGTSLCLWGELASGKTSFVQGLAYKLGIGRLTSPTFIISRQYKVKDHPFIKQLVHIDLYRLDSLKQAHSFDLDELCLDPDNLVVIEWPEKAKDQLPVKRLDIKFEIVSNTKRQISISRKP